MLRGEREKKEAGRFRSKPKWAIVLGNGGVGAKEDGEMAVKAGVIK